MNIGQNDRRKDLRKSWERKGSTFKAFDQGFQDKELETGQGTDRLDVQREVRNVKGKVESIKGSLFLNFSSRRRSQEEVEIKV